MTPDEFLQLPPYVATLIVVMFLPAILAATEFIAALAGDLVRDKRI